MHNARKPPVRDLATSGRGEVRPLTETALSKEPRAIAHPGLNVSVGASLLVQFGNDNVDLEWVGEHRIERDQSNATPIRRSLRHTT